MKYAIVYSSQTGNTALLADFIHHYFHDDECIYYGPVTQESIKADIVFIGFWTDKGTCDGPLSEFLKNLHSEKLFLFGTAGFGGSSQYFQTILNNVKAYIDDSNQIVGTYMCQGKMPMSIHERYAHLAIENPHKFLPLIENFDEALSHPDSNDFHRLSDILSILPSHM